ncbi:MAG: SagB/ThcOx family dehydrogenase [Pseudomonadota bacterium]
MHPRFFFAGCLVLMTVFYVTTAAVADGSDVALPKPRVKGDVSVEAALAAKYTERNFKATKISLLEISQLLWSANGNLPTDAVTGATTKVQGSAGGLYPLEIFLVTGQGTVEGTPAGVFSYDPSGNKLRSVASGDKRTLLAHAAHSQMWLARAPAVVVVAAEKQRTMSRYGPQGEIYVHMEAGASGQCLCLQAAGLGLKTGTIGAFVDARVSAVLELPSQITPYLLVGVGR